MKKHEQAKPEWYNDLSSSPFESPPFTKEHMNQIMEQTYIYKKNTVKRSTTIFIRSIIGVTVISLALFIVIIFGHDRQGSVDLSDEWAPHSSYSIGDTLTLEAFPGGEYHAGEAAGCWWNIYEHYEDLEEKTITINAFHKETGIEIQELPPTLITQSMSHNNFTRIGSQFALPLPGTWKFEITINEHTLGELVFEVPESNRWVNSPQFHSGDYQMTGTKNKIGIINPGFIAGKANKYMWHFWGTPEELTGSVKIIALKQGSTELQPIFEGNPSLAQLNGANASMPSLMSLPTSGQWRLTVYVEDVWFGSIIVQVEDQ